MMGKLKVIWISLMALVLCGFVLWYLLDQSLSRGEILIEFGLMTMVLTFPVGYFIYVGAGLVAWGLDYEAGGLLYTIALWVIAFVAGYYQWFKLLPFLIGKIRPRKNY